MGTATEQCLPMPTAGDGASPPGTSGLRRRGSPRAAREWQALRTPAWPRAPTPLPSLPPPALPWLQPGQGRLSLDSAGGTRGRSCVPTSPHRRPPPSAPSVDRPGAGLGAGRASPGRGLHLRDG